MLRSGWQRLRCVFGHHERPWRDEVDGVKVDRCPACFKVKVRVLAPDPRPRANADPRWRMPARQQHEIRHRAVRLLRKIRVTKERGHLTGVDGGRAA
jgi:hypothetical protein